MTDIRVRIISADLDDGGRWRIGQEVDDGQRIARVLHLIPHRAFVNHAAEYGLNPSDSRTVLDWLLHERFVPRSNLRDPGPFCPYRNDPRDAWAAHVRSISEVKQRVSISDPDGHLEKIHQAHDPHPVQIIQALDRVAQDRAHVAHYEQMRRLRG